LPERCRSTILRALELALGIREHILAIAPNDELRKICCLLGLCQSKEPLPWKPLIYTTYRDIGVARPLTNTKEAIAHSIRGEVRNIAAYSMS
jgi:hypothetical protein